MVSEIWYEILKAKIPSDGVIIEVAPGFKSKIGKAVQQLEFRGTYHLIEPNKRALEHSIKAYRGLLPDATIYEHQRCLHEIDTMPKADALLANHALDDMVLAMGTSKEIVEEFFSMNSGSERISKTKQLWEAINQSDLETYADKTVENILYFISKIKPKLTILSHYNGTTLARHNITAPNQIGSYVAQQLQLLLDAHPLEPYKSILRRAGYGPDWVIADRMIREDIFVKIKEQPKAIERLNPEIFVEERARKLGDQEYEVVYTNNDLLRGLGLISTSSQDAIDRIVGECFAYKLSKSGSRRVYADRQADPTDIALCGNEGSGRACYIGSDFNVKGIGRTQLAKNPVDSIHGTGTLDLITSLRETLFSNFIYENTSIGTSPVLAVFALEDKTKYEWCDEPLPNGLLIRLDRGALDRVSHLAYASANRQVNLCNIIEKYAIFDAEMFAHRILHGAWSTGNSSLNGQWLDMESVSFIQGRGARHNITQKYISNFFGYESFGIKQVIDQLVEIQNPKLARADWEPHFDRIRDERLTYETLRLVGLNPKRIPSAITEFPEIRKLSKEFEALAKKISPRKVNLNIFGNDFSGTHLLNFSALFRHFPKVYRQKAGLGSALFSPEELLGSLLRREEIDHCTRARFNPENPAEEYLATHAVINKERINRFTSRTEEFISSLICLTKKLDAHLPNQEIWESNAMISNKDCPNFDQLTATIRDYVMKYQHNIMPAQELNKRLKKLLK